MADLASGIVKVTAEETTAEQPVSEALAQKIGSAVNAFADRTTITDIKVFTSSGTWTKPANLRKAIVLCTGPGAAGNGLIGFAGGGGGTAIKWFDADQLGATETITISTNTTFGSHLTGNGGAAGSGSNGAGGNPTSGYINIPGQRGGVGLGGSFWGPGKITSDDPAPYGTGSAGAGPGSGICIVIELF